MRSASSSNVLMFPQRRRSSRLRLTGGDLAESAVVLDADALVVLVQRRLAGAVRDLALVVPAIGFVALLQAVASRGNRRGPRARVDRGVRDGGDVVVALAVVAEDVALDDVHVVARELAAAAEARLGVVVRDIDDQRVPFPVAA